MPKLITGSFVILCTSLIAGPAAAASCNGVVIDSRFSETAKLCEDRPAPARRYIAAVSPESDNAVSASAISVRMPGYRRQGRIMHSASSSPAIASVPNGALVSAISQRYRIDPHLLASMMHQESGGRMSAVSNKGALGLMQVMPGTARSVGVAEPSAMLGNPVLAMSAGAVYLKRLQAQFGNNVPLVLAAYNAGPGAVTKAGMRVPNYRETRGYVGAIMSRWARVRGIPAR